MTLPCTFWNAERTEVRVNCRLQAGRVVDVDPFEFKFQKSAIRRKGGVIVISWESSIQFIAYTLCGTIWLAPVIFRKLQLVCQHDIVRNGWWKEVATDIIKYSTVAVKRTSTCRVGCISALKMEILYFILNYFSSYFNLAYVYARYDRLIIVYTFLLWRWFCVDIWGVFC